MITHATVDNTRHYICLNEDQQENSLEIYIYVLGTFSYFYNGMLVKRFFSLQGSQVPF